MLVISNIKEINLKGNESKGEKKFMEQERKVASKRIADRYRKSKNINKIIER